MILDINGVRRIVGRSSIEEAIGVTDDLTIEGLTYVKGHAKTEDREENLEMTFNGQRRLRMPAAHRWHADDIVVLRVREGPMGSTIMMKIYFD